MHVDLKWSNFDSERTQNGIAYVTEVILQCVQPLHCWSNTLKSAFAHSRKIAILKIWSLCLLLCEVILKLSLSPRQWPSSCSTCAANRQYTTGLSIHYRDMTCFDGLHLKKSRSACIIWVKISIFHFGWMGPLAVPTVVPKHNSRFRVFRRTICWSWWSINIYETFGPNKIAVSLWNLVSAPCSETGPNLRTLLFVECWL